MNISIRFSRQTVKALEIRLQQAYQRHDVRLIRRISVLLEYVIYQTPVAVLRQRWGASLTTIYEWITAFVLKGMDSLIYHHKGGRRSRLTPSQKKHLGKLIDAGPEAAGFETGCWSSILIGVVIQREFHVVYSRFYVCELLRNLGYSFQKARFVSDHLDETRRQAWRNEEWPKILKAAQRRKGLILFGDEASFPQWGSLSYTWARRGQQPTVKTTGKRKAYKVFGLIEYFSGRLFYQGLEGKFTSASYQAFLEHVLTQTTEHLYLIQDGAKYHLSRAIKLFFDQHQDRITVYQLPSYSPDYNPIEYLWRKAKKLATHNKYFEQFQQLITSVDKALMHLATNPQEVLGLFGCYCRETELKGDLAG